MNTEPYFEGRATDWGRTGGDTMFKIKGLVHKGDYSRIERRGRSTAEENVIAVVSSVESTP